MKRQSHPLWFTSSKRNQRGELHPEFSQEGVCQLALTGSKPSACSPPDTSAFLWLPLKDGVWRPSLSFLWEVRRLELILRTGWQTDPLPWPHTHYCCVLAKWALCNGSACSQPRNLQTHLPVEIWFSPGIEASSKKKSEKILFVFLQKTSSSYSYGKRQKHDMTALSSGGVFWQFTRKAGNLWVHVHFGVDPLGNSVLFWQHIGEKHSNNRVNLEVFKTQFIPI